jgi:hypothetical protein
MLLVALILLCLPLRAFSEQAENPMSLLGRVIDRDTGEPLQAELSMILRGMGGITIRHIRASEEGTFEILNLSAGNVLLTTKLEGYASEQQSLLIANFKSRSIEFRLQRSVGVRGIISNNTGAPIEDAQIRVIYAEDPASQAPISASYQWEMGEVRTDFSGEFIVNVHPAKEFVIEATHPDFLADISSPQQLTSGKNRPPVKLVLSHGKRLEGQVRDETGHAIADARVQLSTDEQRPELQRFISFALLEQRTVWATTDENGRYAFEHVPAAAHKMIISHPKYQPVYQEWQSVTNRQPLPIILKLKLTNEQ